MMFDSLKENKVSIHAFRHGETDYNISGLISGSDNKATLTDRGIQQALELIKFLDKEYTSCYTSCLWRSTQTMRLVLEYSNVVITKEITSSSRLNERDFGILDGQRVRKLPQSLDHHPVGGETLRDVILRVFAFLKSLRGGEHVLLCGHKGSLRAMMAIINQVSTVDEVFNLNPNNCELLKLSYDIDKLKLPPFIAEGSKVSEFNLLKPEIIGD